MRTIEVKKGSWHYQVATFFDEGRVRADLCAYVRGWLKTITTSLMLLAVTCLGAIFAGASLWGAGQLLALWAASLATGIFGPIVGLEPLGGFFLLMFSCYLAWRTVEAASPLVAKHRPEIVSAVWESLTSRVCFRLRIND